MIATLAQSGFSCIGCRSRTPVPGYCIDCRLYAADLAKREEAHFAPVRTEPTSLSGPEAVKVACYWLILLALIIGSWSWAILGAVKLARAI